MFCKTSLVPCYHFAIVSPSVDHSPLLYQCTLLPTMSMRTSYTANFKRRVILFAESSNKCAAQREFDVNEKLIRGWQKQRDKLFACSRRRHAFHGPITGRHDALEKELRLHKEEKSTKGLQVSCDDIQTKARELARQDGIGRSTFKASK